VLVSTLFPIKRNGFKAKHILCIIRHHIKFILANEQFQIIKINIELMFQYVS
jgi:hypothetical protein